MTLKIVNLDHHMTLPGGIGMPHDRAVVLDLDRTERHIITGEEQPTTVFRGTLAGAHAFVRGTATAEHPTDALCWGTQIFGKEAI